MRVTALVYAVAVCLWHIVACEDSVSVKSYHIHKEYIEPYNCSVLPDYYWRDYHGTIPNDAIVGGSDEGKITYVGQVLDKEWLLPANIYPCQKEALSNGYGKAFHSNNSVKILCSQYKERLRWIATSTSEMHLLTDFLLVVGGTELGSILNIGRMNFEQRVITGKVFPNDSPHRGLSVAKRNGQERVVQTFEVLAFKKHAPFYCSENCNCT